MLAQVVTLTGKLTVDNAFNVYVSTSDNVAGTLVASGANWPQTFSLSANLTPGVVNYLHIEATDFGPRAIQRSSLRIRACWRWRTTVTR